MSDLAAFYGSYEFTPGEAYPKLIEAVPVLSDRGIRWATDYRMTLEGSFCADPQTPLTPTLVNTKIEALEQAFQHDYKDFGWMVRQGNAWAPSRHYLRNDSPFNLSGNKVLRRSWLYQTPTEFANTRSYNVTVGARFRESYSSIISMRETVAFYGTGGPDWVYRETWQTPPERDDLSLFTIVHVVQTGSKVTLDPFPLPNFPLFPNEERQRMRVIQRMSPSNHGSNLGRFTHYAVSWTYHMFLPLVPQNYPSVY